MSARRAFSHQGALAISPSALAMSFEAPDLSAPQSAPAVAVVRVSGPLEHHKNLFFDSYEALTERVALACTLPAQHIVLAIDSPGGHVSGLFDAAVFIKQHCAAAGKTLTAYVDGSACSAAYALACIADRVVTSSTGTLGSIGVIDTRIDVTAADEAQGVKVALITSGARKADGHPHTPISAEELADRQAKVDQLAAMLFEHVAAFRPLSAAMTRSLEARVFIGSAAVAAGLADQVSTFGDLISGLTSPTNGATMSKFDEARAALEQAAESDNEEEANKAKRALAALDASDDAEPKDDDANAEDQSDDEGDKKDEDDKSEASAVSAATAGDLAATVQSLSAQVAQLTSLHEGSEKKAFLASRQDLGKDLIKVLESKPLAEVKQIVGAIPRKGANLAATAVVAGTQGANGDVSSAPASALDHVDQAMGIKATSSTGVERTEHTLVLGAPKARKGA